MNENKSTGESLQAGKTGERLASVPFWGLVVFVIPSALFALNVKTYAEAAVFSTLCLLSLPVKKRFRITGAGQVLIAAGVMLALHLLIQWKAYSPFRLPQGDFLSLFVYYLGVLAMAVLLLKVYKFKRPRELYTGYVISLGLFLVSSLFAPWKWDPVNLAMFSIFAAASIFFFLDLVTISHPAARGSIPLVKERSAAVYAGILVVILLTVTFSAAAKSYEPRALEMLAKYVSINTFYSFPSTMSLGRMEALFQSRKVAMNVFSGRSLTRIRGRIYSTYNGGAWSGLPPMERLAPTRVDEPSLAERVFPGWKGPVYSLALEDSKPGEGGGDF